ncbi:MAG: hypothetical protein K2X39_10255, partial [Silvanigrellaceae bacterium]|nr:hypothetical protein [Silvanigrellaceae bacterium]
MISEENGYQSNFYHEKATDFFLRYIEMCTSSYKSLKDKIEQVFNKNDQNGVKEIIKRLDDLNNKIYNQIGTSDVFRPFYQTIYNKIFDPDRPKLIEYFREPAFQIGTTLEQMQQKRRGNITTKYRSKIKEFRRNFSWQDSFKKFQIFFYKTFLKDVFTILGLPPCDYD